MKKVLSAAVIIAVLTGCAPRISLMDYGQRMKLVQQLEQKCQALGLTDKKQIGECVNTEVQVRENRIQAFDQWRQNAQFGLNNFANNMNAAHADRSITVYNR